MRHRHLSTLRRAIAAILVATQAGCGGWRAPRVPPEQFLQSKHPDVIRVTTVDGQRYLMARPTIRSDSLVGLNRRDGMPAVSWKPLGLPLAQVLQIEVSHTSGWAVAGLVGATLLVVSALANANNQPEYTPPPTGGGSDGFSLGSCPAIYSWDGTSWRLDSGTYSGAITEGLARTEVDNLEYAWPEQGRLRLRMVTELGETDYVDAVHVLAAEHDPGVRVLPDRSGGLHGVRALVSPARATDDRGRDVLAMLSRRDGWQWESVPTDRDTVRLADIRSGIELAFVRPPGVTTARLVVDGVSSPWAAFLNRELIALNGAATDQWYAMLDGNPYAARRFLDIRTAEAYLSVAVQTEGGWVPQGAFSEAGAEVAREQVLELGLSAVVGDTVVVRLESAPNFWQVDQAGMDFGPEASFVVQELTPAAATNQRGDDVRGTLAERDRQYLIEEQGEFVDLTFDLPVPTAGAATSFLVSTAGWYRIHTPRAGAPQAALLGRLATEPWAISRLSTARLNDALDALNGTR